MDVILTLSIKFRLSWDSNTVDCRQVAELEKVLSDRQNIRSFAWKIIMLSDQSKKQLKASIREKNQQDLNQNFLISPPGLGLLLASSLADFLLKQVRQSITLCARFHTVEFASNFKRCKNNSQPPTGIIAV